MIKKFCFIMVMTHFPHLCQKCCSFFWSVSTRSTDNEERILYNSIFSFSQQLQPVGNSDSLEPLDVVWPCFYWLVNYVDPTPQL